MDLFGKALLDYLETGKAGELMAETNISEADEMPIPHFFREYKDMPGNEQLAMDMCVGKILDVGAGSGCHSLHLQKQEKNVTAIDISKDCIKTMEKQGIKNVYYRDYYDMQNEKFDTILFLMNGMGIAKNIDGLKQFFTKAKDLLTEGGFILADSSDLQYMFTEEDGSVWLDLNKSYYGEIQYTIIYNGEKGETFPWLYIDFYTLQKVAEENGFTAELVREDDHFNYLAKLVVSGQ